MKSQLGTLYKLAPNIFRRTQNEGAIKTAISRKVRNLDAYGYTNDIDLLSFDTFAPTDSIDYTLNIDGAKEFMKALNYSHRRKENMLDTIRDAYRRELRKTYNICAKCDSPVRVKTAQIVRVSPDIPQLPEHITDLAKCRCELCQAIRERWNELHDEGLQRRFLIDVPLNLFQYVTVNNFTYADIKTHYTVLQKSNGAFYFALRIGEREFCRSSVIEMLVNGKVIKAYNWTTAKGEVITAPPTSYRLFNPAPCNCVFLK
jgi:hypothetical protein